MVKNVSNKLPKIPLSLQIGMKIQKPKNLTKTTEIRQYFARDIENTKNYTDIKESGKATAATEVRTKGSLYNSGVKIRRKNGREFAGIKAESGINLKALKETRRKERYENFAAFLAYSSRMDNSAVNEASLNKTKATLDAALKQNFGDDFKTGELSYKQMKKLNALMQKAAEDGTQMTRSFVILSSLVNNPKENLIANHFKNQINSSRDPDTYKKHPDVQDDTLKILFNEIHNIDTLYNYVEWAIGSHAKDGENIKRPEPQNTEEQIQLLKDFATSGKLGDQDVTFPDQGNNEHFLANPFFKNLLKETLALHEALSAEDVDKTNLAEQAFAQGFNLLRYNDKNTYTSINDVYQYVKNRLNIKDTITYTTNEQKLSVLREFMEKSTWNGEKFASVFQGPVAIDLILQSHLLTAFELYDDAQKILPKQSPSDETYVDLEEN